MGKYIAWLFLAALVLGIAGLAVATERATAQEAPAFNLTCDPPGPVVAGQGTVTCTISITGLPEGLPDINLTLVADYADVDGSGDPSPGDQLKCLSVTTPGGTSTLLGPCAGHQSEPPIP